jgi:predicted nuclease of predicted toxin-antitoxin system
MRIKLDENLPEGLASPLAALGHDVDCVRDEGLAGLDDSEVWSAAQADHRFLITQDLDFSDMRKFQPGTHQGILLVRLHQAGRLLLSRRIVQLFTTEDPSSWSGCFLVLSDHRLRIRRPR